MDEVKVTQKIRRDDKFSNSYWVEPILRKRWDYLKENLIKKDEDKFYIVTGVEGSGKSVFTLQQAYYIDNSFNLDRVCFTPESFLDAVKKAEAGQVVVFDEAFRGLSSRGAMSKINKALITAFMEMRQKNLVVFLVSPSLFYLERYAGVDRSEALFHIFKTKDGRRAFGVYNRNQKAKAFYIGKKKGIFQLPKTKFIGRFSNIYPESMRDYREKKAHSLQQLGFDSEEDKKKEEKNIYKEMARIYGEELKKKHGYSFRQLETLNKSNGGEGSLWSIHTLLTPRTH